jgi:hypothetical protein
VEQQRSKSVQVQIALYVASELHLEWNYQVLAAGVWLSEAQFPAVHAPHNWYQNVGSAQTQIQSDSRCRSHRFCESSIVTSGQVAALHAVPLLNTCSDADTSASGKQMTASKTSPWVGVEK